MGKTTHRRERRLSEDLRALSIRNPTHFVRVWNLYLTGWCEEVVARSRGLTGDNGGNSLSSLYAVMEKAERLLQMLGDEAERLVGARTRQTLNHECCKAVAMATDPCLYLFETDSVYRLMGTKSGAKRNHG